MERVLIDPLPRPTSHSMSDGSRGSPDSGVDRSSMSVDSSYLTGSNNSYRDDTSSVDSAADTPLDFSIKKPKMAPITNSSPSQTQPQDYSRSSSRSSPPMAHHLALGSPRQPSPATVAGEPGEQRPGVMRSPELGQTAHGPSSRSHAPQSSRRGSPHIPQAGSPQETAVVNPLQVVPKVEEKIGEPQTALPGFLPGMTLPVMPPGMMGPSGALLPNLAAMGMAMGGVLPGSLGGGMDPKMLGAVTSSPLSPTQDIGGKNSKTGGATRPFKAYPKDPLSLPLGYFGLPGVSPFPGMDVSNPINTSPTALPNEDMFKAYKEYMLKLQEAQKSLRLPTNSKTPAVSSTTNKPAAIEMPSLDGSGMKLPTKPSSPNGASSDSSSNPGSLPTSPATTVTSSTGGSNNNSGNRDRDTSSANRKRGRILPEDQKDQAYWERRRKNNDAAKRSRDSRRAKEDEIAIRAAFLEQENLKLRVEVTALKNETAKLRCMLYNS